MSKQSDLIAQAGAAFTGRVLRPSDAEYEARRHVHNGLIDRHPAAIAVCQGTADVVAALDLARVLDLEVSVRGGGHNVAGRAAIDRGLMIDLSPMKGIDVDAGAGTVRAQGGVLWRELNRETQLYALATTGGIVGSTGIAGLTLGGGIGWLMPKYGFALDNLRSVEAVLADGSVLRASATEHPDLFWAMRGGGGNFGIATSLEYAVHPVGPTITAGLVAHPISRALDVLRTYRDACLQLPDEMMLVAALQTVPDGSNSRIAAIAGCHCGPLEAGARAFRALKQYGPPVLDTIGPTSYVALNSMLDPAFPRGALSYWKAQFLADLSDEAIRALLAGFESCPSPMSHVILEHFHGAPSRVPVDATACSLRLTGWNVVIASQWTEADDTDRNVRWTRDLFSSLAPFLGPARYVNYLEHDAAVADVYGPNLPRLRALKARYDPQNVFRRNVNILPAEEGAPALQELL